MENIIISKNAFKTSAWAGGKTTELYIYPEDSKYQNRDFIFRVSSATVELEKSTFTPLEGIKRFISPIDGTLKLHHKNQNIHLRPYMCFEFDGGLETTSEGKARDFNLMLSKACSGYLESVLLQKSVEVRLSNINHDLWILYSPDLNLRIQTKDTYTLAAGDLGVFYKEPVLDIKSDQKGFFFMAKIKL